MNDINSKISKIRLLLLDVDGILTDCRIFMDSNNEWRRQFSLRDGYGIQLLLEQGIQVGFITASKALDIEARAKKLKITYYYAGNLNKLPAFNEIKMISGFSSEQIAYMGDDLFDLPILKIVGFSATVSDAMEEVKNQVDYIANKPAGNGAVREICDLIIKFALM